MPEDKNRKNPVEMKINSIMEISSYYACIFLSSLFILCAYPSYLIMKEYEKRDFKHNLHELIYVALGFSYSFLVLYLCQNRLINLFEPYFMETKKRKNEQKEGRKMRIANYLNGFLYYGSSSMFLFSQFYKTELCPQFMGGLMKDLEINPLKPYELTELQNFFYLFHLGHHIERLHYLVVTSKKSASFYSMFYHHILTILLIIISYSIFVGNYGFMIFFYYDTCEITLNLFRLFREFKLTKNFLAHFFAVLFYINWTITRIYAFSKDLLYALTVNIFFKKKHLPLSTLAFLFSCIYSLLALNVFWHYQITNALFLAFVKKSEKIPWEDTQIEIKKKDKTKSD